MHPEIVSSKPGSCPKCGMKLGLQGSEHKNENHLLDKAGLKDYMPLIVVIGLITFVSLSISYVDLQMGLFSFGKFLSYFMSGFFITFAGFKLMDIKGFADGYATYDLLAKRWNGYGYLYPFIELFFGIAMIVSFQVQFVLWFELIVMTFSGIGVLIKILKKEKFQCACLGTFLKVPLTKVTLIEDFGMAILAAILILLK